MVFTITYAPGTTFITHRLNFGAAGDWVPAETNAAETNTIFQTMDTPALAFLNNQIYDLYPYTSMKQLWMAARDASPFGDLRKWMSRLDQNAYITQVNIPGTHDALASNDRFPRTSTQRMNVIAQLNAGIRYLDIRGGMSKGLVTTGKDSLGTDIKTKNRVLVAYYNFIQIRKDTVGYDGFGVMLSDVLKDCYEFLVANPSECLVLQIKMDNGVDQEFADRMIVIMNQNTKEWQLLIIFGLSFPSPI